MLLADFAGAAKHLLPPIEPPYLAALAYSAFEPTFPFRRAILAVEAWQEL